MPVTRSQKRREREAQQSTGNRTIAAPRTRESRHPAANRCLIKVKSDVDNEGNLKKPEVSSKSNKDLITNATSNVDASSDRSAQFALAIVSYILETLCNSIQPAFGWIKGLFSVVKTFHPKVAIGIGIIAIPILLLLILPQNFSDIAIIGHGRGIRELKQKLLHEHLERTSEVTFLVDEFERLQNENPNEEVHEIISGGPGSGKSELARQLGQRIYNRDNFIYILGAAFDFPFAYRPVDVVTLDSESLRHLQYSLDRVLGKCQGKNVSQVILNDNPSEDDILTTYNQLKQAFKKRSSRPVIIFDNVKESMFEFLYSKRSYGRFLLHPGNDKQGEIRIVVTTQYRPTLKFRSFISYLDLSNGISLDDSVDLLNAITNIYDDNKNASYLAKELGGLPLSIANAGLYIQREREHRKDSCSYYSYLEDFKLQLKRYRHNIETTWKYGVKEGLTYNMTAVTTSIKTIQQLVDSKDHDFYEDVACFVGYCDSPAVPAKFLWQYARMNSALKDYKEFDATTLIQISSIYTLKSFQKHSFIVTHQVTREAARAVCYYKAEKRQQYDVEDSLARIVKAIFTGLEAETESTLNQMVEYTTLDFKVIDVLMSLTHNLFKQKLNISRVIPKQFCWQFLNSMAEAYFYWPNKHKASVIMPNVTFLVNKIQESFAAEQPEIAVVLSLLYIHNTGNQKPEDLETVVTMVENFGRSSLDSDIHSPEKSTLLLNMMGTVYRGVGQKMSKAQELHELALNISRKFNYSVEIAVSLHLLGIINRYRKRLDKARQFHEEAVQLGKNIYSRTSPRLAAFLMNLAVVYNRLGELKKAKLVYKEALNITKNAYGSRDQRVAKVLNTLATNYYSLGHYKEGIKALLEALSIHEEIHGDIHPNVAETLYFLGFTYRTMGDLVLSKLALERSLSIRLQYYGPQSYQVAEVLHDLSVTQRSSKNLLDALQNAEESLKIFQNTLGENSSAVGVSLNGIGLIYLDLGDATSAKVKHNRALEIFNHLNTYGSQTLSISETLRNIGMVFVKLNETEKAKNFFSQSLSMLQTVYDKNHPQVQKTRKLIHDLE